MIFAFEEDGTLEIYATAEDAIREYEGVDVEAGVVHFYDESGTYLEPRFSSPNLKRKLFGLVSLVQSGTYELVAGTSTEEDSFALALHEARNLAANEWFKSFHDIKTKLSAQGVEVELRSQ
ncbi:hypothetical protein LRS11_16245 [Pseudomonas sp. J452]|uniref:hypothetical protein n=1 Tax=Pseudomonas sp. J452 TaxID=2898441 RepID=UPI0021ADA5FF|nr:hypothetical protein [Pseudomonas sp. J452]UUY07364.1 hypothetical protein LRS11_16245 [Pseudomonas sp. J452]